MSTFKEIEKTVEEFNKFLHRNYAYLPKIEFDKGNTNTGVTHKIFKVYKDGHRVELTREKYTKNLLKWLEGYFESLEEYTEIFVQIVSDN